jgi:hypothetical protein
MSTLNNTPHVVADTKQFRKDLDGVLDRLKRRSGQRQGRPEDEPKVRSSRERSLAITKVEEALMWLGKDLQAQNEEGAPGTENPYPESKNPESPDIEPTADGLKH